MPPACLKSTSVRLLVALCATVGAITIVGALSPASADDDYATLFEQTTKHPTDGPRAYAFVRASEARGDYEAAIGTLERLAFYDARSPEIQARLGLLYYQLKSYDMASEHIARALADPNLDAATRNQLALVQTDTAKAASASRFTGFVQTGLRYQSNAAFNPDNEIVRLAGQDTTIAHPQYRGADGNAFVLSQVQHNYDLGNQRGDSLETTLSTYYARQFRLPELSVGFVDGSFGPRLAMGGNFPAGWTWKPFVSGGQVWLGSSRYLSSFGGGVVADLPVGPYGLQPGVEVRRNLFANTTEFSSLGTGTAVTASIAGSVRFTDATTGLARVSYSRGMAANAFQTYSAVIEEFSLVTAFDAPFPRLTTRWSVSPFVRLTQTVFDGANPFIDPAHAERDNEVTAGVAFDTPFTPTFGFATNVQFSKIASSIPNFATRNFSVLSGPVLRF